MMQRKPLTASKSPSGRNYDRELPTTVLNKSVTRTSKFFTKVAIRYVFPPEFLLRFGGWPLSDIGQYDDVLELDPEFGQ